MNITTPIYSLIAALVLWLRITIIRAYKSKESDPQKVAARSSANEPSLQQTVGECVLRKPESVNHDKVIFRGEDMTKGGVLLPNSDDYTSDGIYARTGVTWRKRSTLGVATIRTDKRPSYLGKFTDIASAIKAREDANNTPKS